VIGFLVDQNFNDHIVDGVTRRDATLEFTHIRDVGLAETPDSAILEWAAAKGLVLLTHDRRTIPAFAYERIAAGLPMAGVFLVNVNLPIGQAIEELLIAAHCLSAEEYKNWPSRNHLSRLPARS
jgi:predicted nuclease of predicted toxin-antitoxin system